MENSDFRQNALHKLQTIRNLENSFEKWCELWAKENCPYRIGDKIPFLQGGALSEVMVTIKSARANYLYNSKFEWLFSVEYKDEFGLTHGFTITRPMEE